MAENIDSQNIELNMTQQIVQDRLKLGCETFKRVNLK